MTTDVFSDLPEYPVPTNAVAMRVSCDHSDWRDTQVVLDAVPLDSEFEPQVGTSLDSTQDGWTFTPDKGGIFHFTVNALDAAGSAIAGETTTFQLYVGSRLTKKVGLDEDPQVPQATLVIYVWDSNCRATTVADHGEVTPRLDPQASSSLSRAAVQNSAVATSLAALIDATATQIDATLFQDVYDDYVAALTAPGTIATENPGAVLLIDESGFE